MYKDFFENGKITMKTILALCTVLMMAVGCGHSQADNPVKTDKDTAALKAGERMVLTMEGVEYPFRWCPPGTFLMSSPESEPWRDEDEGTTQHQVTLTKGFWMLETEVTQAMWESVTGENPSYFKGPKKLPVEQVSWDDCQEYIRKLNALNVAPAGTLTGSHRVTGLHCVVRGGSYRDGAMLCRAANRTYSPPSLAALFTGFRLALVRGK